MKWSQYTLMQNKEPVGKEGIPQVLNIIFYNNVYRFTNERT